VTCAPEGTTLARILGPEMVGLFVRPKPNSVVAERLGVNVAILPDVVIVGVTDCMVVPGLIVGVGVALTIGVEVDPLPPQATSKSVLAKNRPYLARWAQL